MKSSMPSGEPDASATNAGGTTSGRPARLGPESSTPPADTVRFIPRPLLRKPLPKHVEERCARIIDGFIFGHPWANHLRERRRRGAKGKRQVGSRPATSWEYKAEGEESMKQLPMPSLEPDASKRRKEAFSKPPRRETGSDVSPPAPETQGMPPPEAERKPLPKASLRRIFDADEKLRWATPPWEARRQARKKEAREKGEESRWH